MYVAVDIETTGLDPETCQILEVAFILDDRSKRVKDCPFYHAIISYEWIQGDLCALNMNSLLLDRIARGAGDSLESVASEINCWIRGRCPNRVLTLLGKNVSSFDWQFLKRLPGFPFEAFGHWMLDVNSLYATEDGMHGNYEVSKQLAEEFEIEGAPHEALYDARVALCLSRAKWGIEA